MNIRTPRNAIALLAGLAMLANACASASEPTGTNGSSDPTEAQTTGSPPSDEVTDATGPITIEHALGELTLDEPAKRVVALEWTYVEDVLAVGVQPVGVADPAGYDTWITTTAELDDGVTDVGTRQEPSLESIAALEPDLILGVEFRHEAIYDSLSAIAPTALFNPYPTEDAGITQQGEMVQTFEAIAAALGREDEAGQVLADMQAAFDQAEQELADEGMDGAPFLLSQAFSSEGAPVVRVFVDTAMAVQQLESIGLSNAWEGEFDAYGFNTVGVEGFVPVEEANLLYVAQPDDDVIASDLADNDVWRQLAFVQEDRVYPLGGDTWMFGGPLSAIRFAKIIADKLLAQ